MSVLGKSQQKSHPQVEAYSGKFVTGKAFKAQLTVAPAGLTPAYYQLHSWIEPTGFP